MNVMAKLNSGEKKAERQPESDIIGQDLRQELVTRSPKGRWWWFTQGQGELEASRLISKCWIHAYINITFYYNKLTSSSYTFSYTSICKIRYRNHWPCRIARSIAP